MSKPVNLRPAPRRGLPSDALMELWCWLWAGVAERELRVWRDILSAGDICKEERACLRLQEVLLRRSAVPDGDEPAALPFDRLCRDMDADKADAFEAELRAMREEARASGKGRDVGGNDSDAMGRVLTYFLPLVARLRGAPRPAAPAPGGGLGPVQTFRFHAWLATTIDHLEAREAAEGAEAGDGYLEVISPMRGILGQWVASLAPALGTNHYPHTTWGRLEHGLEPEPFAKFAGWLAWQARPESGAPPAAREALARALCTLAEVARLPVDLLRPASSDPAPPWPGPRVRPVFFGRDNRRAKLVPSHLIPSGPRPPEPLHEFLAALDRGGSTPPVILAPGAKLPRLYGPPEGPVVITAVSFFGQEIWREGEPFPEVGELQDRLARALLREEAPPAARPAPPTRPAPRPSPPARAEPPPRPQQPPPPLILSPEELPPASGAQATSVKERDAVDRFVLSHPRLHRALEAMVMAGGAAMLLGLLGILLTFLGVDFEVPEVPYLGGTLVALVVLGVLAVQVIPKDADGQALAPRPRDRG